MFSCSIKFLEKRKIGISEEQEVIVFTEEDGTEIEVHLFVLSKTKTGYQDRPRPLQAESKQLRSWKLSLLTAVLPP